MHIMIDISEEIYQKIKGAMLICGRRNNKTFGYILFNAISAGTPLPKGHGRLFDERDIVNGNYEIIGNKIYELDPILEADTESESEEEK